MKNRKTTIDGVVITPLNKIPDERGTIMHGIRKEMLMNDFGELYFKKIYFGVINGWHVHETLVLNYICILGIIKLVLYDIRKDSPTKGLIQELFIGDDNYCLVHIPTGIANGAKGMGDPFSLLVNVASQPHDPSLQYLRIDPHSNEIPYSWSRKDF